MEVEDGEEVLVKNDPIIAAEYFESSVMRTAWE